MVCFKLCVMIVFTQYIRAIMVIFLFYRSPVNKHAPKVIPSTNGQPIIVRADINSPEKPVIDRPSRTARAAVFSSAALRQHKFGSLPSRPTVPK